MRACYEAGPTGYVLYWQVAELGVKCEVIAPTLVPVRAGNRVKTDRRDAEKLARSYRSDDLTAVWVPDEGSEALRDLVRARESAKQDQLRARHRLGKFLLCTGRRAEHGVKAWTQEYMKWVRQLRFEQVARRQPGWIMCMKWSTWGNKFRPAVGPALRQRQAGLPEEVKEIAWKAQHRLHKRFSRLATAGKDRRKIVTAVGRELLGFVWAIGIRAEAAASRQRAA